MSQLPIVRAPTASISSVVSNVGSSITSAARSAVSTATSPTTGIASNIPQFLARNPSPVSATQSSIPQFLARTPAPTISPQLNIASTISGPASLSLSGVSSRLGVPTSIGGVASSLGLSSTALPTTSQALNTISGALGSSLPGAANLNNLSQAFTSGVSSLIPAGALSGLNLPKIPPFPGMDKIGILLGAGKDALAKILSLDSFVPPYIPGLKINMGMALAAIRLVQVALSTNPSELLKHLLDGVIGDLKEEIAGQLESALDSTGISGIQDQIGGIQDQVSGLVGTAENSFVENFNRLNPPRTTTNEDGETIELPRPQPDVSQFRNVSILPPQGTSILQSVSNSATSAGSSILSQAKAFTFPPKG